MKCIRAVSAILSMLLAFASISNAQQPAMPGMKMEDGSIPPQEPRIPAPFVPPPTGNMAPPINNMPTMPQAAAFVSAVRITPTAFSTATATAAQPQPATVLNSQISAGAIACGCAFKGTGEIKFCVANVPPSRDVSIITTCSQYCADHGFNPSPVAWYPGRYVGFVPPPCPENGTSTAAAIPDATTSYPLISMFADSEYRGECVDAGTWDNDARQELYGSAYNHLPLWGGLAEPGLCALDLTPNLGYLSNVPSTELDAIAEFCRNLYAKDNWLLGGYPPSWREILYCVQAKTVEAEKRYGGECRNLASTMILILKRLGYSAEWQTFSMNGGIGHAVVIVTIPGAGKFVIDPDWGPGKCYKYEIYNLAQTTLLPAISGVQGLVLGTDSAGNPQYTTDAEKRGFYCAGSSDGRDIVDHGSSYIFGPYFDSCRQCCEADPKVACQVSTCMSSCKGKCSSCVIGDTPAAQTSGPQVQSLGAVISAPATILPGQGLTSPNGVYTLILQGDGNLVVYSCGRPAWSSSTAYPAGSGMKLVLQSDCNLVLVPPSSQPVNWDSGTAGRASGCRLQLQDDGNLVIYGNGNTVVWSSN